MNQYPVGILGRAAPQIRDAALRHQQSQSFAGLAIGDGVSLTSVAIEASSSRWPGHCVLVALERLKELYGRGIHELPASTSIDFGKVWRTLLSGTDREQAFRAFEVATLLALRRALRNGTVWIDHSLAFRSRQRLFIPAAIWQRDRGSYQCRSILIIFVVCFK